MQLPDFLQFQNGDDIILTGHRIGLAHAVKLYNEGYSAEMIAAFFPTLPLALVHRVIAFYLENQDEVDRHVAAHDRKMDSLEGQSRQARATPAIAELRHRLDSIRRASQG